jgi:hypothetical protein
MTTKKRKAPSDKELPEEVLEFLEQRATSGTTAQCGNGQDCRPSKSRKPDECIRCRAKFLLKKYAMKAERSKP